MNWVAAKLLAAALGLFVAALPIMASAQNASLDLRATASATLNPAALPLGDGKYSTTPRVGYLYPCLPGVFYSITQTGARGGGPWLHGATWNLTEKPFVQGRVLWPNADLTISVSDDKRVFSGNGLPLGAPTGIFPVQESDPAHYWDPNPNPLKAQSISFSVPVNPIIADKPSCIELPIAIGLDGVVFFSALDSHGRDEPAYEMQDTCGGMSAPNNMYHRYQPSDCMPHIHENNALVGYALDGFGIFSPYDEDGKELSTKDLDECHGRTSPIIWDGKRVTMYHYVLTRDYPYSISCFRGVPAHIPLPPPPPAPSFSSWFRGFLPGSQGRPGNGSLGSAGSEPVGIYPRETAQSDMGLGIEQGKTRLPPPSKGAEIRFDRNGQRFFFKCADEDTTKACVDALTPVLDTIMQAH